MGKHDVMPIAEDIEVAEIPVATFDDLQDFINNTVSAGRTSGGTISAHGDADGKVAVAAGTGFIKITAADPISATKSFDWAQTDLTTTDIANNDTSYIYVDYSSGTPAVKATVTRSDIDLSSMFTLGRVHRHDTALHIVNSGMNLYNYLRLNHERLILRGIERVAGGVVTEDISMDRALNSTAGTFYLGMNKLATAQQDTSVDERFTYWYHASGSWTTLTNQQTVSNTQYDNGTDLANIGVARYGVFWVFIHLDGDLHVIYGRGSYKLAEAEEAVLPDIPDEVNEFSVLAAKIIVAVNGTNFTSIVTAYETLFPVSTPPNHWDLGGLQGGTTDEYYHLTSALYTKYTTDVTALAAELNLLDLAGLTAGELLVATGAAAAAWQSTGVTLTSPVLDGTVTNTGAALVLPAHQLGGALDANSQDINNVAVPGAAGDPLIKGTRVTTAELPTLTENKIWAGNSSNVPVEADPIPAASDWKGNFNWDTSAYTTVEQDISALFSTNLAIATRRKYSVKLDLTTVEADGSFDELYLAVKEKIDGTNYRAIDRKTVTKANIAAIVEPGIIIDIPATSENIQITMQMKTALAGDATIYYAVVKEHLE